MKIQPISIQLGYSIELIRKSFQSIFGSVGRSGIPTLSRITGVYFLLI